jgi:zinc protease
MLLKGTPRRSARDIATEIESVGGSIDSYGGNNSFGVNAGNPEQRFYDRPRFARRCFAEPDFSPPMRSNASARCRLPTFHAQKDNLLKSASLAMRRALFGRHGYGLDSTGTEETVAKIQAAGLKSFHKKLATPNNCVLAIYGDVKAAEVKAAVEKVFGGWKPGSKPDFKIGNPGINPVSKRVEKPATKSRRWWSSAFPARPCTTRTVTRSMLIQESCSDLGSRLFLRIREQLGLAYYVGAQHFAGLAPGYFVFYAGTEPSKAAQVEQEILKEAELLRTEG